MDGCDLLQLPQPTGMAPLRSFKPLEREVDGLSFPFIRRRPRRASDSLFLAAILTPSPHRIRLLRISS